MKTLFKFLPLVFALALFSSCSSDSDDNGNNPPTRELILSVEPNKYGIVETSEMDYEFEIKTGNGGYKAKVSEHDGDPDAKVTIDGNKVTVNILVCYSVEITIMDAKNCEQSFLLESTNEELQNKLALGHYGIYMDVGQESILSEDSHFTFGAGAPYTIEHVRGTASKATMEGGFPKFEALSEGITYYKLRDKRGSVLSMDITSGDMAYEITEEGSKHLEIEAKNNYVATVRIDWGEEWKIIESKQTIIERASISRPWQIGGTRADYHVLFIYTTDKGTGEDIIRLEAKDGKIATVKVIVKP